MALHLLPVVVTMSKEFCSFFVLFEVTDYFLKFLFLVRILSSFFVIFELERVTI